MDEDEDPASLDQWKAELDYNASFIRPESAEQLNRDIEEIRKQAKEIAKREAEQES